MHKASLHFKHLPSLQISSSNSCHCWKLALVLEVVAFYCLKSYLLHVRHPLPTMYPTGNTSAQQMSKGRDIQHTHTQLGGHPTPTAEAPSLTPAPSPPPAPAESPQEAPAELSGHDHAIFCLLLQFITFIYSSFSHPPFTSPSTCFCQFLASSLPTHKTQ